MKNEIDAKLENRMKVLLGKMAMGCTTGKGK